MAEWPGKVATLYTSYMHEMRKMRGGAAQDARASRWRDARWLSRVVLAAGFAGAGAMHFVLPGDYARIIPRYVPHPVLLVYVSGLLEAAGGVGLLVPRVRRAAGMGLVLLLLAVWPANLQMLLDARAAHASLWAVALLWARMPLQVVLMAWVWWSARSASTPPA